MSGTVLVDISYGDCGKGRIVDFIAKDYDVVVKYNGGSNSGRTVFVGDEKFVFRSIPSGILHPHVTCLIGQGMVIDPLVFQSEIEALEKAKISVKGRLFISGATHVIMPYHIFADGDREANSSKKLGTTKKGIGPCYEDKTARKGIRVQDLGSSEQLVKDNFHRWMSPEVTQELAPGGESFKLREKISIYEYQNELNKNIAALRRAKEIFAPYILDVPEYLDSAFKQNKVVLFEGAQGSFLDVDHGTYPYVTSSSACSGGACTGAGVGPTKIDKVIGVSKAYTTRVGEGPFITELLGADEALASLLRTKGHEFGSVTGRPRRVGWLDLVEMKQACIINGVTELMITKLDVLSQLGLERFKVRSNFDMGVKLPEPKLQLVDGWQEDISKARKLGDLPSNARKYIEMIENEVGVPVSLISVGPERDSNIVI